MLKHYVIYMVAISIFLGACCDKDESNIYYFNETGCANPWDGQFAPDSFSTAGYQQQIQQFLESEGIEVRSVNFEIDSSVMMVCYACHCTTGKVIIADVECGRHNTLIELGFFKE